MTGRLPTLSRVCCLGVGLSTILCRTLLASSAEISIDRPADGSLVQASAVMIEGSYVAYMPNPKIRIMTTGQNYKWMATLQAHNRWSCKIIAPMGDFSVMAYLETARDIVTLTRPRFPLSKRPTQYLRIIWSNGTAESVLGILRNTLEPDPKVKDEHFGEVRAGAERLIVERLSPFDIQLTADPIKPAHSVLVSGGTRDGSSVYFGWTSDADCDCGNPSSKGESYVYLGAVADSLSKDFAVWAPMSREDSLDRRITDLSYIVADLILHEFLHGLGIIACDWTASDQTDHFHNPPGWVFDQGVRHPRWNNGANLMDSGEYALGNRYFGEPNIGQRLDPGVPRVPRALSPFDVSYLGTLYPRP